MLRSAVLCIALLAFAAAARGEEVVAAAKKPAAAQGDKQMSGMSILGNDDAPKSLVIVPWKSSELGDPLAVSRALDDGRQPVDRDVFTRELEYYEIRAATGAPRSLEGARWCGRQRRAAAVCRRRAAGYGAHRRPVAARGSPCDADGRRPAG